MEWPVKVAVSKPDNHSSSVIHMQTVGVDIVLWD